MNFVMLYFEIFLKSFSVISKILYIHVVRNSFVISVLEESVSYL